MSDITITSPTTKEQWAGHYAQGGSDKVWGAGWEDTTVKIVWGKRGAALQHGDKSFPDAAAAEKHYRKKVAEKVAEGYVGVAFDHPNYGIPSFFPTANRSAAEPDFNSMSAVATTATVTKTSEYVTSHVLPLDWAEVEVALVSPLYGLTEKVNGERCIVTCDAHGQLTAYNRKGVKVSTVPEAAQDLAKLYQEMGAGFVLDGERLIGEQAGKYVVFDMLEWEGVDVRRWPYSERIEKLEGQMRGAGLIRNGAATHAQAESNSHVAGLSLLVAECDEDAGREAIAHIQASGLEGIIVRTMVAPYQPGDTRHVRKFKFQASLDCFVVGVKPGLATGSVVLGLLRPADGAIIEVGSVRGGLKDPDINRLAAMLAGGEQPVLQVEYLPVRTVGVKLVEPRTDISQLRSDKLAAECTTEQFGPAKANLIAAAKPYQHRG